MEKIKTINDVFLTNILSEVMIDKIINIVSKKLSNNIYNYTLFKSIHRTFATIGTDIKEFTSKKF